MRQFFGISPSLRNWRFVVAAALLAGLLSGRRAEAAYTPQSPEVQEMLQPALGFLQGAKGQSSLGGDCLIGLTCYKNDYELSHPLIVRAVNRCKAERKKLKDQSNYDIGLAVIFLCEAGAGQGELAEIYLKELLKRQLPNGAWSYEDEKGGDTSQTQYAVLAMWTAKNTGHRIPPAAVISVCKWLMTSRDASGGWVYHPYDSSHERKVTVSLSAAGLGSIYICADILGIKIKPAAKVRAGGLPAVLVRVEEAEAKASLPRQPMAAAMRDGNAWIRRNYARSLTPPEMPRYPFYALYAIERYQSFRERADGTSETAWYDQGVKYLKGKQLKDGSFVDVYGGGGGYVQTCFAILFLMRSTKKSIHELSEGQLKGGVGLPSNDSTMRLYGGRIVAAEVDRSLSELLELLEDQETTELKNLIRFSPDELATMPRDPDEYARHMQRLRGLLSHKEFEVRMVAVRTLAQARDLDNVPALIFALTDPNNRVVAAARDGLRFVSRKVDGFGLAGEPDSTELASAINSWKQWYLSIRPRRTVHRNPIAVNPPSESNSAPVGRRE